jgi:hypothetical protein
MACENSRSPADQGAADQLLGGRQLRFTLITVRRKELVKDIAAMTTDVGSSCP